MKRSMAIALMIGGVLFFTTGVLIYFSQDKPASEVLISSETGSTSLDRDFNPLAENISKGNQITNSTNRELDKAIEVAISDGVLSNNERKLIKKLADENGVDFESAIKNAEMLMAELGNDSPETAVIDYNVKNGYDFEKYVVSRFNRKFFKVKEWAGDKYTNGIYAETNMHPDILFEFKLGNVTEKFSVECKWRSKPYNGGIEFSTPEQLERYKKFEQVKKVKVFIAFGIGGTGGSPEKTFMIPLKKIDSHFISLEKLKSFEKKNESNFFFNAETKEIN